jgi:hypothetical protein
MDERLSKALTEVRKAAGKAGQYVAGEVERARQIAVQPFQDFSEKVAEEIELTKQGLSEEPPTATIIQNKRRGRLLYSTAPQEELSNLRRS